MVRLRSVGVLSCAKIYGIIHMALGILFGVFFVSSAWRDWLPRLDNQSLG